MRSAKRPSQELNVLLTSSMRSTARRRRGTSKRTSKLPLCSKVVQILKSHLRQQEEEYLSSFTDKLSAGTTWSRICDYVELQNSQSKTLARTGAGTTDLTRFKEVLLRLRREGEAAPGAAGY